MEWEWNHETIHQDWNNNMPIKNIIQYNNIYIVAINTTPFHLCNHNYSSPLLIGGRGQGRPRAVLSREKKRQRSWKEL